MGLHPPSWKSVRHRVNIFRLLGKALYLSSWCGIEYSLEYWLNWCDYSTYSYSAARHSWILCAIELHCYQKHINEPHCSTWWCVFSLPLTWALQYIFIPHTLSCSCKYLLKHQMSIHLQLKTVPNKCTINSCLSNIFLRPRVLFCFSIVFSSFQVYTVFSWNEWTCDWVHRHGGGLRNY